MRTSQLQYEMRDVDIKETKTLANDSLKRIQKNKDKRLNQAIREHDSFYISRELSNVSSYELLKMILSKFVNKYTPFNSK